MSFAAAADGFTLSRYVQEDKVPWYRKRNLRLLYLLMLPTCIGASMTSGFDGSVINGLQAVPSWDAFFNHPRSTLLGLLSAMYTLGGICCVPFAPLAADKLGRRLAMAVGSVIMIIGAALQAASQNFAMFVIARFLLGFGFSFSGMAAPLMTAELAYPKERAQITSLIDVFFYAGAIIAAGITLGTFAIPNNWGWRIPSMLQAVPSLLQLTIIWFLPESPRWLVSKGRGEEAYEILATYHAEGDLNSEFVKLEYAEIEKTLAREKEQAKNSWKQLIATPGMRRRLLVGSFLGIATMWSGSGLLAYYLVRILENIGVREARTQNLINLALSCWAFLNGTILALIVPKGKRRTAYLTCTIALTVVFTGWTIASAKFAETGSQAASRAVIALIFLYSPIYNIAYNVLTYTYLVELFPFQVRAKGVAVFSWWFLAAGAFNQFVNPIGINNTGWKYYIAYCIFLLFQVVFIYFLFPETANRSLEELAFLYEDDKPRVALPQEKVSEDDSELDMTKNA